MICAACSKLLVVRSDPPRALPFVRFYGYVRRVPVTPTEKFFLPGPMLCELDGYSQDDMARLNRPWGPDIENARFYAHPLSCIDTLCIVKTIVALDAKDSIWQRDDESFTEPTGTSVMRIAT